MNGHQFHPSILREYDIRGVVGETLSEADAAALGRAYGTLARSRGAHSIAVGYDGRLSSPALAGALVRGLCATGLDCIEIGRGPTPMLYFATFHLEVDGGLMVTGSHNPPEHNGFKMVLKGDSVFGATIKELGALASEGAYAIGTGSHQQQSVFDAYVARIAADYNGGSELRVAWDPGNGAAGEVASTLTARLPGRHFLINEKIDGTFPSHHPDPTVPANLKQLQDLVKREGCDLGIAFDGDGDRIGAVDEKGRILWGDQLMLLLARDVLEKRPGAPIIADVKASQVLFDGISAAGGRPIMWKTGHSLIKAKMKEEKAPFAGEMSAHLFFADRYYGYDDALYASVRLLSALGKGERSLASFRDSLPDVVNTPEIRFDCPEERKFDVVEEVRQKLERDGAEVVSIDGVRVRSEDGWWLLRASNTQAVLVARCEAPSESSLERLKSALRAALDSSGVDIPEF